MKNLVLLRGVPGAGKTKLAGELFSAMFGLADSSLKDLRMTVASYSADMYFERLGYFDASKLKEAHTECVFNTKDAMERACGFIFVHNTFTQEWEMEKYRELAKEYDYMVHSVIVENRHHGKNEHSVSFPKIEKMAARFETKLYDESLKPALKDIIEKLKDVPQQPDYHPEGNVWIHTALVTGQLIKDYPDDLDLHWTGLIHDIGKLHTTRFREDKQRWIAYGHEISSEEYVKSYADVINGYDLTDPRKIAWLVRNHMKIKSLDKMRESKRRDMESHKWFPDLVKFGEADNMVALFERTTESERDELVDVFENFLDYNGLS